MLAELQEGISDSTWIEMCQGDYGAASNDFEVYICSCYYVMTTTSTVGYGDISPCTSIERIFGMALMLLGVIAFTFVSGALASIL